MSSNEWMINVIHRDHEDLAIRFATRGADKFAGGDFVTGESGLPVLTDACVTLHCRAHARYDGGDHTILVGRVEEARMENAVPAIYFRRTFHQLQRAF